MLEKLNLDRSICFLDIQTTGLSFKEDRIIELFIKKLNPDGSFNDEFHKFINPGDIKISKEAFEIHSITEESLKGEPEFKDLANEIFEFIGDSHIGGFNVSKFDLPFLIEQFYQNGIVFNFLKNGRKVIDTKNIFVNTFNPNSIEFAYEHLIGSEISKIHTCERDVDAAIEMLGKEIELCEFNIVKIEAASKLNDNLDLSGKVLIKDDIFVFNFGKYFGKEVFQIFKTDIGYYQWLMKSNTISIDTKIALKLLKTKYDQESISSK